MLITLSFFPCSDEGKKGIGKKKKKTNKQNIVATIKSYIGQSLYLNSKGRETY
jgi:hypothetical protein